MLASQGCCNNIEIKFTSKFAPWMQNNIGIYHLSGKDNKGYNVYKSSQNKVLFRHESNYWLVSLFKY